MDWQARGDDVEGLSIDGVNRHLRSAEQARIVERSDFEDDRIEARPSRGNVGAARLTEFARHRLFQIAAGEGFWRAADVAEPFGRQQHEHVRCAATDILTFPAVALRFQARFALRDVSDLSAIAAAFERHVRSSAWRDSKTLGTLCKLAEPTLVAGVK